MDRFGFMAHRVCPWWFGYFLVIPLRRRMQDPGAILGPFVSEGMTVLEPGPGMGFFTLELARRVGPQGRVLAIDVQGKMLESLVKRAAKAGLAERINARLPRGRGEHLGIENFAGQVDFALAFAMVHEVPCPAALFGDIYAALKPGGKLLFAEPTGHVGAEEFEASAEQARKVGFVVESRPTIWRSRAAVLVRPNH
jgi:ubiquinone/menaquinone biosynthesis C-methylase UbiE